MDNGDITSGYILRLIGFMAIAVGLAWALQTVAFGNVGSTLDKALWVMAAAAVSGAGAGLIVASTSLPENNDACGPDAHIAVSI